MKQWTKNKYPGLHEFTFGEVAEIQPVKKASLSRVDNLSFEWIPEVRLNGSMHVYYSKSERTECGVKAMSMWKVVPGEMYAYLYARINGYTIDGIARNKS